MTWPDLWVSVTGLRRPAVLVDHAAKDLPALHRPFQRHDHRLALIRWPLVSGLVRPVPVIVPGVRACWAVQAPSGYQVTPVRGRAVTGSGYRAFRTGKRPAGAGGGYR